MCPIEDKKEMWEACSSVYPPEAAENELTLSSTRAIYYILTTRIHLYADERKRELSYKWIA